jgi:hypothetical protein
MNYLWWEMFSNEEIIIRLASKREGINPDEGLNNALKIQRPIEWVDGA